VTAPVLTGDRVVLRPVEDRDRDVRRGYGWHAEIERGYGHPTPTRSMTEIEAQAWFDEVASHAEEPSWVIDVDGSLVGIAFLHAHAPDDRRARFAIGLFAPHLQGKGFGTDATRLVLRHAFDTMGLHRVDLRVLSFNAAAIACYLGCGFVEEGRERESCLIDGEWYDDILMGVLEREFRARDGR
jgi:ribosomal-protein-alanine N-acetyltransferase